VPSAALAQTGPLHDALRERLADFRRVAAALSKEAGYPRRFGATGAMPHAAQIPAALVSL
jgi:hypothetical protein